MCNIFSDCCYIMFHPVLANCMVHTCISLRPELKHRFNKADTLLGQTIFPLHQRDLDKPVPNDAESNERIEVQPFAEPQVPSMIPSQKGCASCRISDLKTGTHCAQSFLSRYELIASTVELLRRLPPLMQAAKAWSCRVGLKNSQTYE